MARIISWTANAQQEREQKVYRFTDEQLSEINEALEQYKNGDYMTDEEAEIDIQEWFDEQEK